MYSGFNRVLVLIILVSAMAPILGLAQTSMTVPTVNGLSSRTLPGEAPAAYQPAMPNLPNTPRVLSYPAETDKPGGTSWPAAPTAPQNLSATPAIPPSEFEEFVSGSLGRKLPVYGHSLFDQVPTTFAPIDRVPVTANYVIGPGDELMIRTWGGVDLDAKVLVDRSGNIYLPKVGSVTVAGLTYQQLPECLKAAVGKVFRSFDLNVNLGQLRSIQIFVLGQARRPGTYTVGSLSTLVNALFASGGPSINGSMRHIQVMRNSRVVTDFDLYDLLLKGNQSKDVRLLPGDVIYIPPVGPQIAVAGSVKVPAIYEAEAETRLGDALAMAGGLANTADGQKVSVERIENRSARKVEEFPLDQSGLRRELKDGDLVRVFALSPRFENAVTLRGNVARPGRYEWHRGMRVRDLIPNQEALVTRDYWRVGNSIPAITEMHDQQREFSEREYLRRGYSREREQEPTSQAQLPEAQSQEAHAQALPSYLAIQTGQNAPNAKLATENTTSEVRDELKRTIAEINWDYAAIQRLNPQDLTTRLIPFNLGKVVLEGDETNNVELEAGDIITIFSQSDLAVPQHKRTKFVRLEGEVRAAGVYRAEAGETLKQLLAKSGGLTPDAYLYGAQFTRETVQEEQQKGLDRMIENLDQEIARNASAPGGISAEEASEKRSQLDAQRQLVDKLRLVKASGRLVLELRPDANGIDSLPNIVLEDGDRLVIPSRSAAVDVLGSVYNKNSFFYRSNRRVADYLKLAGGATRDADKSRVFVVRADGSVVSKQSMGGAWTGARFESLLLMPGDAIVVPERLNRGATLKAIRDWSQVFSQFALGAAAVRVLN
jgi:protein involved in polysaccharide export with SLBB domain